MNFPTILIHTGCMLLIVGIVFYFAPGVYNWIGKLPGDIRIEKKIQRFIFQSHQ